MPVRVIKKADLKKKLKGLARGNYSPFMNVAGKTIVQDITGGILQQRSIDGGRMKENKASTKKIKQRYLGHTLSLIWNKILVNQGTYKIIARSKKVKISVKSIRNSIGKRLIDLGYQFYGISNWIRPVILKRFRNFIFKGFV